MTTRAELAFKALDKDNSGYISGYYIIIHRPTVAASHVFNFHNLK